MTEKKCRRCGRVLTISSFYIHKQMADGYLNICKDCVKNRVSQYREANIELIRAYDRQRGRTEKHQEQYQKYANQLKREDPEKFKAAKKTIMENYNANYPDKYQAHMMVGNKLRNKEIIRKPCEVCGTTRKVEAHHDDYSKPLAIRWLCKKHHMEIHRMINDARRTANTARKG